MTSDGCGLCVCAVLGYFNVRYLYGYGWSLKILINYLVILY